MNESKFKVGDKVTVGSFHTVYTVRGVKIEEDGQISYSLGWEVDHENTWWNYYEHELNPAPVDILAAKNERIAELEKRNGDLEMTLALVQTLVITLRGGVKEAQKRLERSVVLQEKALLTAMIAEKTFLAKQLEETLSEMKTEPMQAPQAAPVQAEAVTLTDSEIEWLATHEVFDGDSEQFMATDGLPQFNRGNELALKLYVDYATMSGMEWYKLKPAFDTPANRAAIAARRAELGLS